jgi:TfoX/Sxy family transcriptional regulator of competence genes
MRFAALARAFANEPGVSVPDAHAPSKRTFGSNGLKYNGKLFAMLSREQLVLKLPRQQVDAFVAAGEGQRMVSGGGREMREWLVLDSACREDWTSLARQACAFVKASASVASGF